MSFTFPSSPTLNQQYSVSGGPTYTWNGTAWIVLTPGQQFNRQAYTATANQTSFSVSTGYLVGGLDVFRNGVKLITGTDYTATDGSTFILILPANNGDTVECICYSQILYSDALRKTGDTMTGNLTVPNITSNGFVVANNGLYSSNNYTGTYTAGIVVDYVTGNGRISVGSGDGLTIYNGGVANTSLVTLNSSGNLTFNTASSVTFNNNTAISAASTKTLTLNGGAGSNGLVINASNNVGIGTATPSSKLSISSTNALQTAYTGQTLFALSTDSMAINLGGSIAFGGSYTGTSGTIFAAVSGRKETGTDADVAGYLAFATRAAFSAPAERMRLDSSGNLGLGVTPGSIGSGHTTFSILAQGNGLLGAPDSVHLIENCYWNGSAWVRVDATATSYLQLQNGNFKFFNGVGGTAGGAFTPNQAMTLDASGNLVVGGTTSYGKLASYGNLVSVGDGTTAGLALRSSSGRDSYGIFNVNESASSSALGFYWVDGNADPSTGTERARIDSSGNFIVGTAALSTSATSGFHWIPSCAGTPTGAATQPYSGASGLVVDSTNGRLYVRSGSNWIGTNIGNATSTAIYSHYPNIASFTPSANATDWYRVVSFTGSNQPSFVRLHISIPGVHFQCLVDVSRGAGGDFVQTQFKLLGNYAYWGQYPMDWRLVPTGTNLPTYLDVRFSAFTSGGISPVYIAVLESITTDSGHPTFPGTNVGTAAAGYGIRIGTTSGFTYPEFKIRPGVWAREDASFVRTTGTVASGAVQT